MGEDVVTGRTTVTWSTRNHRFAICLRDRQSARPTEKKGGEACEEEQVVISPILRADPNLPCIFEEVMLDE